MSCSSAIHHRRELLQVSFLLPQKFCCHKHVCCYKSFVSISMLLSQQTKVCLSWQNFCFVSTSILLSQQTKVCLLWQNFCCDKIQTKFFRNKTFVLTSILLLQQKLCLWPLLPMIPIKVNHGEKWFERDCDNHILVTVKQTSNDTSSLLLFLKKPRHWLTERLVWHWQ